MNIWQTNNRWHQLATNEFYNVCMDIQLLWYWVIA